MTLRQYWADAYCTRFTAQIVSIASHAGQPALILDQTAFYPTAGGQPHDMGVLNGVEVVDVVELPDRQIAHVLATEAPALTVGAAVQGELNWTRRFDHMQQHSGQHVLSQALIVTTGLETVAVHIGADDNTLDVPGLLSPDQVAAAEQEASRILYENRPIACYEVSFEDLHTVPLRKPPKKSADGKVRIVEVQDYDWSACGGTHVRGTAEIGLIKIIKAEKRGSETRLTFRCGGRAWRDYVRVNQDITQLAESLSVARYDVVEAVARLRAEAQSSRKALETAQEQLLQHQAQQLLAETAPNASGLRVVAQGYADRDMNQLRVLAKALTAGENVIALLGNAADKSALCFARSKAPASMTAYHMGDNLKQALAQLGGKGGGSADFAQGGGPRATIEQIIDVIAEAARNIKQTQ